MMFLLLACHQEEPEKSDSVDESATDSDSAVDTAQDTAEEVCEPAPLPLTATYERGYTGSEDFAFDDEGYLISVDFYGNLVGINRNGDSKIISPAVTTYAAGMQILPDGDIVFCDAEIGSLLRVDPATGGVTVVLSGLLYPNGMDLGTDGMLYVAEQISGKVRQVNPDTGESQTVAHGLYSPNGVSFSPDEQTMFVGSFGAGVVWAVDRLGDGWAPARVYARTPGSPGVPPDYCDSVAVGSECPLSGGYGVGECVEEGDGDPFCGSGLDTAACDGRSAGDACTTTLFGEVVTQHCQPNGLGGNFCPASPADITDPCDGKTTNDGCTVGTERGFCYPTWEGVQGCYLSTGSVEPYTIDCETKEVGDACVVRDAMYPSMGTCGDGDTLGIPGIICIPYGLSQDNHGGIDGLNVDECGNLYATEYILGEVWRFEAEGAEAEEVAHLRSSWIPNLHWGNGVGGWEKEVLYVMDREKQGIFELPVGVGSHRAQ